ncbi:unnamed protein product [Diatraea saccharalis]|uniref:RRM domain-containing protein n=1 Tax=Diatraea saccharalis TaxID=40085 RepID=A0A9P0C6F5_9NEOP|nr:unnamed protein product [Diatraea saccharalis]
MRRKSERTATKKTKASPEKKIEKVKRTRTRRRKQSASSDNESADEVTPVQEKEIVADPEQKAPQTPGKEASPEDAPDQVWHVKTTEGGDVGEIQKLKICLTRPPSTPERVDRSPRSKRKHSRATSSSDTPSSEGVEEKKKSKHRSKRSTRDSKDDSEKNHDSQEEPDVEAETSQDKSSNEISQSTIPTEESISDNTPMSTTNEEVKIEESCSNETENQASKPTNSVDDSLENRKSSDADTTVASPKVETTAVSSDVDTNENRESVESTKVETPKESSEDKSEVLELHAEENKCESIDTEVDKSQKDDQGEKGTQDSDQDMSTNDKVSKNEDETDNVSSKATKSPNEHKKSTDETDVVENSEHKIEDSQNSVISTKEKEEPNEKHLERTDSTQSAPEDTIAAPIVISRKRRWGSRPNKSISSKSLTISTDVLKEIIPDVKPTEFDEVIEDKKNKREVIEKLERPVLPKIVIDNSESVENNKRSDEKDVKPREIQMLSNRKISIVKENDSIIARPPSPPRNKQSCILYITNLVRPFTLAQLRNLLQRTGRIVEEGFWIDRIKSKCYVKYENEDQAVETRHALHGVTWPVSNPKTLQVDFSTDEAFEMAKTNEETDKAQISTIPGTVEDWLREQDMKRERGEDKSFERKAAMREWDMGKNDKDKDGKEKLRRPDDRPMDKRRHRSIERSPEPARKFKKKEEEAPAKLLDDLFRKTKTTPCIYWLPLSAETVNIFSFFH